MSLQTILAEAEQVMKRTLEKMSSDFSGVRTGRASSHILDPIRVKAYGADVPLQQVGTVAVTEGRTIEVRPWDVSLLPEIEKAVLTANLGVTPNNDGKIMRLVFPALNEDRRKDLVKLVKKMAEDFRISLRNERRDAIEKLKKEEKDLTLTKDLRVQGEEKVTGLTNIYIKKIDDFLANKEKEILEV